MEIKTLILFAIITLALILAELAYFAVAKRYGIIDRPNLRSSHHDVTLRGGGIIFMIAPWIWQIFFGWHYTLLMIGLTAVGLVSFIDDVHSLRNRYRLAVQFGAVALMICGVGLYSVAPWWIILLVLIVGVGIINAYNFMDGINGITGCYSLSVLLPLLYLNHTLHFIDQTFLIVVGLSILVFLFFNFRERAKCFAGDVGAISMAFILLYSIGALIMHTDNLTYILLLGVYGADSILTIVHRIQLGEHLGEAHRKHAYQLMSNELHIPHRWVSIIYMALQLLISFGLIACEQWQWWYFAGVCLALCVVYVLFMRRYYSLHAMYLKQAK